MLYQTEGIVLSAMDLGEHDRVVSLITGEEGLVRAVVKGARKPKSKLAAVTQPFTRAQFQLFRGSSMDRVTQVSLVDSHPGIIADYSRLVYGSYLSEITSSIVPERERNPEVYALFAEILDCLEGHRHLWTVARWAELRLLGIAGFMPSLDTCSVCGGVPADTVLFSPQQGGILCEKCRPDSLLSESVIKVSAGSMRILSLLAGSRTCPNLVARGQVRDEAGLVMKKYIAHILGKRPKSLALVERLEVEGM